MSDKDAAALGRTVFDTLMEMLGEALGSPKGEYHQRNLDVSVQGRKPVRLLLSFDPEEQINGG